MTHPQPLAGLDTHTLAWAGLCALLFSLSRLPERRRRDLAAGKAPAAWWEVLLETVLGGFIGGVVFALALPEFWSIFRGGPGKQAALAVAGAALGPYLGAWIVNAAPGVLKQRLGVDVGKGGGDDGETKA